MATDPYWQLEKEYSTITSPNQTHDLTIKAIAYEQVKRTEGGRTVTDSAPCKVHEYRVQRTVLGAASPVLRKMLTAGFRESESSVAELHGDSEEALGVWLKIVHAGEGAKEKGKEGGEDDEGGEVEEMVGALEGLKLDGEGFGYKDLDLKGVWEMLSVAHKYEIDPKGDAAKIWFERWYNAQAHRADNKRFGYLDFQALILPCHAFDFVPGFAFATKQLVYRSNGHITERQPNGFVQQDNLHLDHNIISQLNAAKGRLKTVLHRDLYNPIDALLKRGPQCPCKPHVLYAWEQALSNTGAWPLETTFQRASVNEILRQLETFRAYQPQTCGLPGCTFDFAETVRKAVEKTRTYFDGLCLDCISLSSPKFAGGDHDEDYWHHADASVPWDHNCRIRHKQPSWYFSFMGRRQVMTEWTKERRNNGRRGGHEYGHAHMEVFE